MSGRVRFSLPNYFRNFPRYGWSTQQTEDINTPRERDYKPGLLHRNSNQCVFSPALAVAARASVPQWTDLYPGLLGPTLRFPSQFARVSPHPPPQQWPLSPRRPDAREKLARVLWDRPLGRRCWRYSGCCLNRQRKGRTLTTPRGRPNLDGFDFLWFRQGKGMSMSHEHEREVNLSESRGRDMGCKGYV